MRISLAHKIIFSISVFMLAVIASIIIYTYIETRTIIIEQNNSNMIDVVEASEGQVFALFEKFKIRTSDWSSDGFIRSEFEKIIKSGDSLKAEQLAEYIKTKKQVMEPGIIITDIFSLDGVAVVSTTKERVGYIEPSEEIDKEYNFSRTKTASFGKSFTSVISVVNENEPGHSGKHLWHVSVPIVSAESNEVIGVMVNHILVSEFHRVLSGKFQMEEGAITGENFFTRRKSAEIYLVNKEGLMITPSRFVEDAILKQGVDTEPVRKCFENSQEINGIYKNYLNKEVLGASMCMAVNGLALVAEIDQEELLSQLKKERNHIIWLGFFGWLGSIFLVYLLIEFFLRNLIEIRKVAEEVSKNNFKARVKVSSQDEIGYLAKVFNQILDNLENHYKNIGGKEEELKKEVFFTGLLQKISSVSNETSSFEDLIKFSLDEICSFAKWPVGHSYFFDKNSNRLIPSEIWHFDEHVQYESFKKIIMATVFKPGDGIIGKIYQDKTPVWKENIAKGEYFKGITEKMSVKGFFAFPVVANSEVLAVFDFYHNEEKEPDNELLKVLSDAVIQLGIAIEKKQADDLLKKHIEKTEETKTALYNILEDMKESENIIKKEHHRMAAITSSIGEGLFVVDEDFKIILINPTAQKLLEISEEDALGKKIKEVIKVFKDGKELEGKEHLLADVMREGKIYMTGPQDNIFYKTLSGKMFPVTEVGTPLKDGITGAVIVFKDITGDKAIDEARTNFVSTTSHQLRTPLTSMKWFSEMLVNGDAGALNKEQENYVQNISQSIERMIAVVNLLLQIARVEAGRLKIEPVPVDLKKVANESVAVFRSTLEEKFQKVEIVTEPKNLPTVPMDRDVIDQAVQNLLSNAIRYTPINKTIKISIIVKGNEVEFSIKDNGIGIPKEQKGRVFEKFFRANNALKMVPEGSGLGLSLVKMLVDGWGGKIWFESEEGNGTAFFFTIPLEGMKSKEGEVKLTV